MNSTSTDMLSNGTTPADKATARRGILRDAQQQPEPSGIRVLVVEDEPDIQESLCYMLQRQGFDPTSALTGEHGLVLSRNEDFDLIMLDLMLPGMDGLEVCRAIRANPGTSTIPIVMLTAKGEELDMVIGLEMGADDYIAKPFRSRELIARLKAVLRRHRTEAGTKEDRGKRMVRTSGIVIDPERHEVLVRDQPVDMTATEFRLLCLLASQVGRVFTRHQIINEIHGDHCVVTDRSVDTLVVSVRRKLGESGDRIQTVRGVGYRFKE